MKIYDDGQYRVIEVNAAQFDSVTAYLRPTKRDDGNDTKYLLGNSLELAYLSETLDIHVVELVGDFNVFKLIKAEPTDLELIDAYTSEPRYYSLSARPMLLANFNGKVIRGVERYVPNPLLAPDYGRPTTLQFTFEDGTSIILGVLGVSQDGANWTELGVTDIKAAS